tara:strand:+ start:2098 stop:2286 length:189 start_codon:yes stop_codon:yes gene_type:complete
MNMHIHDLKVGDLVEWRMGKKTGIIVGFNEKGEGGKDFAHVLIEGDIIIFMSFDLYVVNRVK